MKSLLLLFVVACGPPDPNSLQDCDDHCHVMPESAVADDIVPHLRETSPGFVCVPDRNIADNGYKPLVCTAILFLEGRCLGKCIPEVGAQATLLAQDACPAGEVCVPCKNPFTAASTGACVIGMDHPGESQ